MGHLRQTVRRRSTRSEALLPSESHATSGKGRRKSMWLETVESVLEDSGVLVAVVCISLELL